MWVQLIPFTISLERVQRGQVALPERCIPFMSSHPLFPQIIHILRSSGVASVWKLEAATRERQRFISFPSGTVLWFGFIQEF